MRISKDIYKTVEGELVAIDQMTEPPTNSKIWEGYDYEHQYWVSEGKRDTRTLDEIKNAMGFNK